MWSVIGGIAHATQRLRLGTGVTCPTIRIHPAIIAQAAATAAAMMPGRFFLGLGTGENLNEHILGDRWPSHDIRLEMLEEAVEVIRLRYVEGIKKFIDAGYDHVYIHQIGPDQEGFFQFYKREILPRFR